jgi:prepilin-type N-terminal cleavage/methylation domain-containing protein
MRSSGFTLVELTVALLIVALLLAGALIPLTTQIEVRNTADTQRTMDQIKESIIGFAQANGRLPCPADPTIASGATNAGAERATCNTLANMVGVVPWATLGTPELDAWGRRFTYRVAFIFADPIASATYASAGQAPTCTPPTNPAIPAPTLASFALCSLGDITVKTRDPNDHATKTALVNGAAAVIISHGKNGNGARLPSGLQKATAAANTDEAANATFTAAATTFYSRDPTPTASGCDDTAGTLFCEFDDIVTWIAPPTLVARMVSAGKLP